MDPKISIIIPVYNSEKTIKICIDNILRIKKEIFEVIVVNDGGTDSTIEICNTEYSQIPNVKVYNRPHLGVSATRNFGIEKASGEWLVFVDSDQTLSKNVLDNIDDYTKQDLVLFNRATLWIKNGKSYVMAPEKLKDDSFVGNESVLSYLFDYLPSTGKQNFWVTDKFFKTSIVKDNNIRFPEHIDLGEDGVFVNNYLKYVSCMCVESKLYNLGIVKRGLELQHLATKKRTYSIVLNVIKECYTSMDTLATSNNSTEVKCYAENYIQDRCIRCFIWGSPQGNTLEYENFINREIIPILRLHDPNYIKCKDILYFRNCLLRNGVKKTQILSSVYSKVRSMKSKITYVTHRLFELI